MGRIQKLREQKRMEAILEEDIRKKKKKKISAIGIAIILILIIGAGAVFYFSRINKEKKFTFVTIETEKGNIELELDKEAASKTVENFVKLAKEGFYDGTKFHRVVEDFVIQAGDPLSKDDNPDNDGIGGPGYNIEDEINPKSLGVSDDTISQLEYRGYKFNYSLKSISHKIGVISMANSGQPNTGGSQFFIVSTQDQPDLDGRYTAFGRVTEGMDVVRQIKQGDIINKVTVNN
jgi:peptidyl-prolyl cis-trans isomerase B (cyclophilin B)